MNNHDSDSVDSTFIVRKVEEGNNIIFNFLFLAPTTVIFLIAGLGIAGFGTYGTFQILMGHPQRGPGVVFFFFIGIFGFGVLYMAFRVARALVGREKKRRGILEEEAYFSIQTQGIRIFLKNSVETFSWNMLEKVYYRTRKETYRGSTVILKEILLYPRDLDRLRPFNTFFSFFAYFSSEHTRLLIANTNYSFKEIVQEIAHYTTILEEPIRGQSDRLPSELGDIIQSQIINDDDLDTVEKFLEQAETKPEKSRFQAFWYGFMKLHPGIIVFLILLEVGFVWLLVSIFSEKKPTSPDFSIQSTIQNLEQDEQNIDPILEQKPNKNIELSSQKINEQALQDPSMLSEARKLMKKGNLVLAEDLLSSWLDTYPNEWEGYYLRGKARLKSRNLVGSKADLSKALQLNPNHPSVLQQRAWLWMSLGEESKAITDLDSLLSIDPKHRFARYNKLMILGKRGKISSSEAKKEARIICSEGYAPACTFANR
jgi:tetratricopeptide (TPR) repeat protein